jgi:hypothetical protein
VSLESFTSASDVPGAVPSVPAESLMPSHSIVSAVAGVSVESIRSSPSPP